MDDIWTHHTESLNDLIREALETRNYELLRGIQCFSECTRWSTSEGLESILNIIFEKSIQLRSEAIREEQNLTENEEHYQGLGSGAYNAMQRRIEKMREMRIPFITVKNCCLKLSRRAFIDNINFLEESGYIETERKKGGREGDAWELSTLRLTPRYWDGVIQDAVSGGELSIYPSALATMISFASRSKTLSALKPVINALNRHPDGQITHGQLEYEYLKQKLDPRKMANFIERDAQKADNIRAIAEDDGDRIIFSRDMILANQLWLERTRVLIRTRARELG